MTVRLSEITLGGAQSELGPANLGLVRRAPQQEEGYKEELGNL